MRRRHYTSDVVVLVIVIKMVVYRWEVVRVRVGSKKSNRMTLDTIWLILLTIHTPDGEPCWPWSLT